jgi:hypothetical protein
MQRTFLASATIATLDLFFNFTLKNNLFRLEFLPLAMTHAT